MTEDHLGVVKLGPPVPRGFVLNPTVLRVKDQLTARI